MLIKKRNSNYLHKCPLDLSICRRSFRKPTSTFKNKECVNIYSEQVHNSHGLITMWMSITNSVDLIHEDNAGLMVSGIVEHLSDESGALTNVLVNNGAGHDLINNMFYSTL